MRYVLLIVVAIVMLFLQTAPWYQLIGRTLPTWLIHFHVHVATLFAIYLGFRFESVVLGSILAFSIGMLADIFSPLNLHLHALFALIAFLVTYNSNQRLYIRAPESIVPFAALICAIYSYCFVMLVNRFAGLEPLYGLPHVQIIVGSIIEGACAYGFMVLLDLVFGSWSYATERSL